VFVLGASHRLGGVSMVISSRRLLFWLSVLVVLGIIGLGCLVLFGVLLSLV
jgi:hypothetical protein